MLGAPCLTAIAAAAAAERPSPKPGWIVRIARLNRLPRAHLNACTLASAVRHDIASGSTCTPARLGVDPRVLLDVQQPSLGLLSEQEDEQSHDDRRARGHEERYSPTVQRAENA